MELENCGHKISVIIPLYNVEPYLARCLDSVVSQTYSNLEIILVDDGSSDKSGAICDSYAEKDSRVTVIHQENGGASSARNAALEIFSGDYVTFVDSDDWVDPRYCEILLERALEVASPLVQCNFYRAEDDENKPLPIRFRGAYIDLTDQYRRECLYTIVLSHSINYYACGKLVRADVLKRHAIRWINTTEVFYEDRLFTLSLLSVVDRIDFVDDCLYYYCGRVGALSDRSRHMILKGMVNTAVRYGDFIGTLPADKKRLLREVPAVVAFVFVCAEYRRVLRKNDADALGTQAAALRVLYRHPNTIRLMLRVAFGRGMSRYCRANHIPKKTILAWRALALGTAVGRPAPFFKYM